MINSPGLKGFAFPKTNMALCTHHVRVACEAQCPVPHKTVMGMLSALRPDEKGEGRTASGTHGSELWGTARKRRLGFPLFSDKLISTHPRFWRGRRGLSSRAFRQNSQLGHHQVLTSAHVTHLPRAVSNLFDPLQNALFAGQTGAYWTNAQRRVSTVSLQAGAAPLGVVGRGGDEVLHRQGIWCPGLRRIVEPLRDDQILVLLCEASAVDLAWRCRNLQGSSNLETGLLPGLLKRGMG